MPQYTDSTGVTWNYTESGGNATIGTGVAWASGNATTLGTDLSGAITIPSTVDGYTVTDIGSFAFYQCTSLTSVDLGNSVTSIGAFAFYNCNQLTSITFPNSLTTIYSNTFQECSSLTSITVDANNNSFSDINGVLFNKDQSTLIQYPIGKTATSYTFPDSVATIGNYAFHSCSSLTSIHFPNSLTTIGSSAFRSCSSLTSIDLSGTQVTTIDYAAFRSCSNLTSIDLGNSLTTIDEQAFYKCSKITSITIPDSVETIGYSAFYNCRSLTSITIPDSVTTIGSYAFYSIGSSVIVYVKDVDPNDAYTMTTLKTTISGKISSGNGAVTYTQWVEPNYAPNTPTLSDISCNENTPYNATVSATDNNGDSLTFDLSGADAADFTLSGTTLSAIDVFDFETKETYNITITASDGSLNTSADFTITVNNIVESAAEFLADVCFIAGTPVTCDQGFVAIDKLDVSKHTIRGKPIVAVTKTITDEKHIVCIRKDALAKNVPSQDTLTTQNHCFFYNGNMVKAKHLVSQMDNVDLVKYDGCTLYNVLQDKHEKMVVNNLIAETLQPNHCIAQMYRYFAENKVSPEMQQKAIASLNNDRKKKILPSK